jgi:inorganic phosphate transporter, PiT family
MTGITGVLICTVAVALIFDFTNGFHDSANAIATSIGTRALRPVTALGMAACLNIAGGLIFETRVAQTMTEIVRHTMATEELVLAALAGAILWNLFTWYYGIPSSSSHALIGGLIGSALGATLQLGSVRWMAVLVKVIVPTVLSPLLGLVLAAAVTTIFYRMIDGGTNPLERVVVRGLAVLVLAAFFGFLLNLIVGESLRRLAGLHLSALWFGLPALFIAVPVVKTVVGGGPRKVNHHFRQLQRLSAGYVALEHGHNDAQKTMGVITLALVGAGLLPQEAVVPLWVKFACASVIGLGTFVGGKRIIKTMGMKLTRLEPANAFCADTVAASVIGVAGSLGMPISTTHAITAAITGAGAAKRVSAVSWSKTGEILAAWLLTLPASGLLAAASLYVIHAVR